MVITIEPSLFIPDDPNFPKEFRNLAIRVEDEVLVGKKDPMVLSVNAPKEVRMEFSCFDTLTNLHSVDRRHRGLMSRTTRTRGILGTFATHMYRIKLIVRGEVPAQPNTNRSLLVQTVLG